MKKYAIALLAVAGMLTVGAGTANAACQYTLSPSTASSLDYDVEHTSPGNSVCLSPGTYNTSATIGSGGGTSGSPVVVRSTTFNRADVTITGRIETQVDYVRWRWLTFSATSSNDAPTFLIEGDHDDLMDSYVTNSDTGICINIGYTARPVGTNISRNYIEHCGANTSYGRNHDHGIYCDNAVDTVVFANYIRYNAARGLQQYPNCDSSLVTFNAITNNNYNPLYGAGMNFSSGNETPEGGCVQSDDNEAYQNIVINNGVSDVYTDWGCGTGSGNSFHDNCADNIDTSSVTLYNNISSSDPDCLTKGP